MKKVYVVVGICYPYDEDAFTIVSAHAVKSTLEKAQDEFVAILNEIAKEAAEQEYKYSTSFNADKTLMRVTFNFGTEEVYKIHEQIVDF